MRSFEMIRIRDHSDQEVSKEPMNTLKERIHRFLRCTSHDPRSLILFRIISNERTLSLCLQDDFKSVFV